MQESTQTVYENSNAVHLKYYSSVTTKWFTVDGGGGEGLISVMSAMLG